MSQNDPKNYTRFYKLGVKARLSEILDFGPEPAPEGNTEDVNKRLMKIIKALQQEIEDLKESFLPHDQGLAKSFKL